MEAPTCKIELGIRCFPLALRGLKSITLFIDSKSNTTLYAKTVFADTLYVTVLALCFHDGISIFSRTLNSDDQKPYRKQGRRYIEAKPGAIEVLRPLASWFIFMRHYKVYAPDEYANCESYLCTNPRVQQTGIRSE